MGGTASESVVRDRPESRLVLPSRVKTAYGDASIISGNRVVFNIGGNRYRLIIRFDYPRRIGSVRFVGTHAEYDRIDAYQV